MRVEVLPFGVLRDWLGSPAAVELPEGASVAMLLDRLRASLPTGAAAGIFESIAVSVNAEYADGTRILCDQDEVGLLPPVSGGGPARTANASEMGSADAGSSVALTRNPIDSEKLIAEAKSGEDGAVVVFDGIVRNHTRGRRTLFLDYEAYEEMALREMRSLASKAIERFGIRHVTLVHRLGRLQIGETSVLIVIASEHRSAAFEACRWIIDTLKQIVPIWKRETFADGAVWAPGEPFPKEIALQSAEAPHEN